MEITESLMGRCQLSKYPRSRSYHLLESLDSVPIEIIECLIRECELDEIGTQRESRVEDIASTSEIEDIIDTHEESLSRT